MSSTLIVQIKYHSSNILFVSKDKKSVHSIIFKPQLQHTFYKGQVTPFAKLRASLIKTSFNVASHLI